MPWSSGIWSCFKAVQNFHFSFPPVLQCHSSSHTVQFFYLYTDATLKATLKYPQKDIQMLLSFSLGFSQLGVRGQECEGEVLETI